MATHLREFLRGLLESLQQNDRFASLDEDSRMMLDNALERILEDTDKNIQFVPGYKEKLCESILNSLEYIDKMTDQIPAPLELNCEQIQTNPYTHAIFYTKNGLQKTYHQSSELKEYFLAPEHRNDKESCAVLCMKKLERKKLGMQLKGNLIMRDVKQTQVLFEDHHIQSPAEDEEIARRELKCCIFEGLLDNALEKISVLRAKRAQLETKQQRIGSRLRSHRVRSTSKEYLTHQVVEDESTYLKMEVELGEINDELEKLGYMTPEASLKQVDDILNHPDDYISIQSKSINLDKDGVLSNDDKSGQINHLDMSEVTIKGQPSRVVMLVNVKRDDMGSGRIKYPYVI